MSYASKLIASLAAGLTAFTTLAAAATTPAAPAAPATGAAAHRELVGADGMLTVRIVTMQDNAGPYARLSGREVYSAVQMAIHDHAAEGGRLHAIIIGSLNEGSSQAEAEATAKAFLDKNPTELLVGLSSSGSAAGAFKQAAAHGVIGTVGSGSSTFLINGGCTPLTIQMMQNTWGTAKGGVEATIAQGRKNWFIAAADYSFGKALLDDATVHIIAGGGKVVGSAIHPFPNADFTEIVAKAKESGADAIGIANAGGDMVGFFLEAKKQGLSAGGKVSLVPLAVFQQDVEAMGSDLMGPVNFYASFLWNQDPKAQAWSARFYKETHRMPELSHAAAYSSTLNYLRAADAIRSTEPLAVMKQLRSMTINDAVITNGHLREDGSLIHDGHLARIKPKAQMANAWDYYEYVKKVDGADYAFPAERSTCSLMPKAAAKK